jgi:DNA (cytosine-5)-methyltransferase 1
MTDNSSFTFIDLFAGIGGFRLALNNLGGTCLHFSEINKDAINTYCTNFGEGQENNLGDITKIEKLPSHDLLVGGVPCQSWSIAGKNLGFDDDRGQLWNDTICLLNQAKPKAFIFENVKGLADPRNKQALQYILDRIRASGYFVSYYVLNSFDYGVPQNRVRVYIIGFRDEAVFNSFKLPKPVKKKIRLGDILNIKTNQKEVDLPKDLFNDNISMRSMSLSNNNGFNDYFLFNDLRNGHTTIHSWDILDTTSRQKEICYLLLKNRRKSTYGKLDGNPLSIKHFQSLDPTIKQNELDGLVALDILKAEEYAFAITDFDENDLTESERILLALQVQCTLNIDDLKSSKYFRANKISLSPTINALKMKNILSCTEVRYDFKNTKISTGLYGINRVFLPSSNIFPTLVASDTHDYVTLENIEAKSKEEYREKFIKVIFKTKNFRKVTKEESCKIQGFPKDYILPDNRARWMKLLGNSVSVPVIEMLGKAILDTGVFAEIPEETSSQYDYGSKYTLV